MKIFNSQKFLAAYSGVLTLIVTAALLSGFSGPPCRSEFIPTAQTMSG